MVGGVSSVCGWSGETDRRWAQRDGDGGEVAQCGNTADGHITGFPPGVYAQTRRGCDLLGEKWGEHLEREGERIDEWRNRGEKAGQKS